MTAAAWSSRSENTSTRGEQAVFFGLSHRVSLPQALCSGGLKSTCARDMSTFRVSPVHAAQVARSLRRRICCVFVPNSYVLYRCADTKSVWGMRISLIASAQQIPLINTLGLNSAQLIHDSMLQVMTTIPSTLYLKKTLRSFLFFNVI